MYNLSNPEDRANLEIRIKNEINDYCAHKHTERFRDHLGASVMGEACSRKLWYMFRWVKGSDLDGRIYRLFQVGHNAEPRFIEYLEGIGFKVWATNPDTGKQFRISAIEGHYGGSLDGICKAPDRYELDSKLVFLNEFKTNGTGKGFMDVDDKGLQNAKPKHYAQMCQYGKHFDLQYGLYLIENKNDSDIIVKIVPLDWTVGDQLEKRAKDIITSPTAPNRISENPAYFECKFCDYSVICWGNEKVEINCRSCKMAEPVEAGEWKCHRYQNIIPKDFIPKGCEYHVSVND